MGILERKLAEIKSDAKVSTTSCSPEDRTEHFVLSHTECDSVGSLSARFLDEKQVEGQISVFLASSVLHLIPLSSLLLY